MMYRTSSLLLAGIGVCLCTLSPLRISAAEQDNRLSRNPCTCEANDLQRRRQVLDQMTMRILPNGYVRQHADH